MNNYINLSPENIEKEHICCAIGDKKHQAGVENKKKWIRAKFADGHVFRKLDARGKIFIEYEPIESACEIVGRNTIRNGEIQMNEIFKSVLEQDRSSIVICDLNHKIIYMNPAAIKRYEKRGGEKLVGQSLLNCHNAKSCELIEKVLAWFAASRENNMIFTSRNEKDNKDVYMVALRDENGKLIAYYEKHEYRNAETAEMFDFSKSLV